MLSSALFVLLAINLFYLCRADISFPRTGMAGCRVNSPFFSDQQLVVAGGVMLDGTTISNQVDSLEIASGVWTTQVLSKLSIARYNLTCAVATDLLLFGGGLTANGPSSMVDLYNYSSNIWFNYPIGLSEPRSEMAGGGYYNIAIFAGGRYANGSFSDIVDIFASNKSEFVTTTSWATDRLPGGPRAGALGVSANGVVLITPGQYIASTVCDLFYPVNLSWSSTNLQVARRNFAASPMQNRYFIVFGGIDANNAVLSSLELYDTYYGTWSIIDMVHTRQFAVALAIGPTIMVTGGYNTSSASVVEFYNHETGVWKFGVWAKPRINVLYHTTDTTYVITGGNLLASPYTLVGTAEYATDCGFGSFVQLGPNNCTYCPAGTYSQLVFGLNCTTCPLGYHNFYAGASVCVACEPGTYPPNPEVKDCLPCALGYWSDTGAIVCSECYPGTYAQFLGTPVCPPCPNGTFTSKNGTILCDYCPASTYSTAGLSSCLPCPAGTASYSINTAKCPICDAGTYSTAGLSACLNCPAGYWSGTAMSYCYSCIPGKYSASLGSSVCAICDRGTHSPVTNLTSCIDCPPGYTTLGTGTTVCTVCDAGRYSPSLRSTSCTSCLPGFASGTTGLTVCAACDYGFEGTQPGTVLCTPCIPGYYAASQSTPACSQCDPGKINVATGMSTCVNCPIGMYQNRSGSTFCIFCPGGNFSASIGSPNCDRCSPGQWSWDNATTCNLCEEGLYSKSWSATTCSVCKTMPLYWTKGMTFCPSTVSSALSRLSKFFSRPTRRRAFKMASDLVQSTSGMVVITVLLAWLGWMAVTWWT